MNCSDVSAVIVTRGDRDLSEILASLPFDDVVVWDNSREPDRKVYGRYLAIERARHDVIYTQDDDCLVPVEALVSLYRSGEIVANVPEAHSRFYRESAPGITLVGWGACFDRNLVDFSGYLDVWPFDELFLRECDRVFSALAPWREVRLGHANLPHAYDAGRMGREARHLQDLAEIWRRMTRLRAAA